MIFPHPAGYERKKRKPEKEMKIGPHDPAVDVIADTQQMVMIVPVNPDINEAQNIGKKYREKRFERCQPGAMRHPQFQDHDGDDDREYTVTEGFESVGLHDFCF